jgi:AmiR/NasT family two-component response regulator
MDDDPRDRRIEQLQKALDSRVVIEQAKGIVAERFGITVPESFELLRRAARANRLTVRALAEELTAVRGTPGVILEELGRYRPETP